MKYLGCYWKLPKKHLGEKGSFMELHKSSGKPGTIHGISVSPEDEAKIKAQV